MKKFPLSAEIQAIKEQVNLAELLEEHFGVELTRQNNRDFLILCPFHGEKTPSCRVNESRYHCFGCGMHGDAISAVMGLKHLSFKDAIQWILSLKPLESTPLSFRNEKPPPATPYDANEALAIIEANERDYTIEWDVRLRHRLDAEELVNWGVTTGDFGTRMLIPVLDRQHRVRGFIRRALGDEQPKYLNPKSSAAFHGKRTLFGLHQLCTSQPVLIVEGPIDCIKTNTAYPGRCVSTLGCHLSIEQLWILEYYGAKRAYLLYDGDEAGIRGMIEACKHVGKTGVEPYAIFLPRGHDPDTYFSGGGKLNSLAYTSLKSLMENKVQVKGLKPEYDRSLLDKLIEPYVRDNIRAGFPHYNVVDYVMQAWPEFGQQIREATIAMVRDVDEVGGVRRLKSERVKTFIKEWIKPCREVRKRHAEKK